MGVEGFKTPDFLPIKELQKNSGWGLRGVVLISRYPRGQGSVKFEKVMTIICRN